MARRFAVYLSRGAVIVAVSAGFAGSTEATLRTIEQQQFQLDRFGLLIAYGPKAAQSAAGIETTRKEEFHTAAYRRYVRATKPNMMEVAGWCELARKAGARYVTFTAKSFDGYAEWQTDTEWGVGQNDVVKTVVNSCHHIGVKVFLYYCLEDWHSSLYNRPYWRQTWNAYLRFVRTQVKELLTRYGLIDGVWLDGIFDRPEADWHLAELYALVRRLQPRALIVNNHHGLPRPGEDFQTIEQGFPGAKNSWGVIPRTGSLPIEATLTFGKWWYYSPNDRPQRPLRQLLAEAEQSHSNLLLGIGPKPDGTVPLYVKRALLAR